MLINSFLVIFASLHFLLRDTPGKYSMITPNYTFFLTSASFGGIKAKYLMTFLWLSSESMLNSFLSFSYCLFASFEIVSYYLNATIWSKLSIFATKTSVSTPTPKHLISLIAPLNSFVSAVKNSDWFKKFEILMELVCINVFLTWKFVEFS